MSGNTTGGNDTLIGGAGLNTFNSMRGDGDFMRDNAHGGDDTLIGGDGSLINYFFGDAFEMRDAARGGNDTLIGGPAPTTCGVMPRSSTVSAPIRYRRQLVPIFRFRARQRQRRHQRLPPERSRQDRRQPLRLPSLDDMMMTVTARTPGSTSTQRTASHLSALPTPRLARVGFHICLSCEEEDCASPTSARWSRPSPCCSAPACRPRRSSNALVCTGLLLSDGGRRNPRRDRSSTAPPQRRVGHDRPAPPVHADQLRRQGGGRPGRPADHGRAEAQPRAVRPARLVVLLPVRDLRRRGRLHHQSRPDPPHAPGHGDRLVGRAVPHAGHGHARGADRLPDHPGRGRRAGRAGGPALDLQMVSRPAARHADGDHRPGLGARRHHRRADAQLDHRQPIPGTGRSARSASRASPGWCSG